MADSYVVALNNAPPYRIIKEKADGKEFSGIYVDFIRELAGRLGFPLEFKQVPFRRALALMENGDADIMVGPDRTGEREKYMLYLDEAFTRERKAFFTGATSPDITRYEDLETLQIGVHRGSVYFERFDLDPALKKVEVSGYSKALTMLAKNGSMR